MAGLPRSGSTLTRTILNTHSEIYAGPISPSVELLYYTQSYFDNHSEMMKSYPRPESCYNVLSQIVNNFYEPIMNQNGKSIILDHNRAIPNNIERFRQYVTEDIKIICPVRGVLDILTSFITLIHKNSDSVSFIDQYLKEKNLELTDDNRCDYLMSPGIGIVDESLWALSRAYKTGEQNCLYVYEYDDLVKTPVEILNEIHDFLNLERYEYSLNNLENEFPEDDIFYYNLAGMHSVRRKIEKISNAPEEVLSDYVLNKYNNLEFWRDIKFNHYLKA